MDSDEIEDAAADTAGTTTSSTTMEGKTMSTTDEVKVNNIFKQPDMMGMGFPGAYGAYGMGGAGVGLGGIGGFLAGAILARNGGLFGGDGNGGNAINQVTLGQIQGTLGDIKASVPLAEAQVQLALAGAQDSLSGQATNFAMAQMNQASQAMLANAQGFANTGDKIDVVSTSIASGLGAIGASIDRNTFAISQVITNDGDKTRALITNYETANANRRETILANEISDLRAAQSRMADTHGINIQMLNNQTQNQLQQQQQSQDIRNLWGLVGEIGQVARATNQSLIIGNSGAVASGPQTANPTNVRV